MTQTEQHLKEFIDLLDKKESKLDQYDYFALLAVLKGKIELEMFNAIKNMAVGDAVKIFIQAYEPSGATISICAAEDVANLSGDINETDI